MICQCVPSITLNVRVQPSAHSLGRQCALLIMFICLFGCHARRADLSGRPAESPGEELPLVSFQAAQLSEITWRNEAGRRGTLQQIDGIWYYAGMEEMDQQAISLYLAALNQPLREAPAEENSVVGLTIGEELLLLAGPEDRAIVLTAYPIDSGRRFLIHSTHRPADYFLGDSLGLYARIFTSLRRFWPDGQ